MRIDVRPTGVTPWEWYPESPGERIPYEYEVVDFDSGEVLGTLWAAGDYHDGPWYIAVEKAIRDYPDAEIRGVDFDVDRDTDDDYADVVVADATGGS